MGKSDPGKQLILKFGKPMQTYGAFADNDLQVMDVPSQCEFTGGHS